MPTIDETPCPSCGAKALRTESRLEAKPLGTYSLAGSQLKVVVEERMWLVCGSCGVEAKSGSGWGPRRWA